MLQQYLVVFGFFIVAMLLMLLSLHFSKYKKKSEGCCGGGGCATDGIKDPNQRCSKDFSDEDTIVHTEKVNI